MRETKGDEVIMGGKGSGRKKAVRINIDPTTLTDKEIIANALGKPLANRLRQIRKHQERREK